jgi:hypothetical protein
VALLLLKPDPFFAHLLERDLGGRDESFLKCAETHFEEHFSGWRDDSGLFWNQIGDVTQVKCHRLIAGKQNQDLNVLQKLLTLHLDVIMLF